MGAAIHGCSCDTLYHVPSTPCQSSRLHLQPDAEASTIDGAIHQQLHDVDRTVFYAVRCTSTRPSGVGAGENYGREPRGKPRCFYPYCFRLVRSICSLDWSVHDCVIAERFRREVFTYTNLWSRNALSILLHQTSTTLESGRLNPTYANCI